MPPLIFEMKILKYTFRLPELAVINDELQQVGYKEETYTFTLLFKGIGVFEELAHRPLLSSLMTIAGEDGKFNENAIDNVLSKDFISNLACASYVKIENGKFHNNRATAEEFKKTNAYYEVFKDMEFINALIQMAIDCIREEEKEKAKTKASTGKNL